jgi:Superfamily I DNA and RNA helicases
MLLDGLNEAQKGAVEQTEGAMLIIAGAGSGKTRTLTYKIAYLIEKGVSPFNILALTFTNKAAQEMKERITNLVGPSAMQIWMGTFHSVFSKVIRIEAQRLGYLSNFTIYDTNDSKNLLKAIIKDFSLDDKIYNKSFVQNRISAAKNNLISPVAYKQNVQLMQEDESCGKKYLSDIYIEYNLRLRRAMAMDFDDLLFNMNVLLRDNPDLLLKYQEKFQYVLVDEYQDTNYSQYYIIKKLSARFKNICVVGDDSQSIYAFRGANIQNILNFQRDYKDAKVFKLEQNYRSTQNIVNAANSLIEKNVGKIKKNVWTSNVQGDKITYQELSSDKEEASYISGQILKRISYQGVKHSDFAILYRTNQQSRAIEESLRFQNIPYRIFSGLSFYDRKEIKDLLAYFRLVVNNYDDEAFIRVINFPARGIGETSIGKLRIFASENNISLFASAQRAKEMSSDLRCANKIEDFVTMIKTFSLNLQQEDAFTLGSQILAGSHIIKFWKEDEDPGSDNKIENIEELMNALQAFVDSEEDAILDELTGEEISLKNKTLDVFLQQVSLMSETDRQEEGNEDTVSLMTIHAAKGLEFPYVFVAGMEENLFPSVLSLGSRDDLEEERRLLYVAMTRAEKELFLTCAQARYRNGQMNFNDPSRFIDEIDSQYLNGAIAKQDSIKPYKQEETFKPKPHLTKLNSSLPNPIGGTPVKDLGSFALGMRVFHDKFGSGVIKELEGKGDDTKALVVFDNAGEKKLVLRFAKLKKQE